VQLTTTLAAVWARRRPNPHLVAINMQNKRGGVIIATSTTFNSVPTMMLCVKNHTRDHAMDVRVQMTISPLR
jgi:hypothetical protein